MGVAPRRFSHAFFRDGAARGDVMIAPGEEGAPPTHL